MDESLRLQKADHETPISDAPHVLGVVRVKGVAPPFDEKETQHFPESLCGEFGRPTQWLV